MASRFWVLSNEDSRSARFRQLHVQQNGGSWSFESNLGWQWKSDEEVQTPKLAKKEIHSEPIKTKKSLFKKKNKETNDN